jgi:hypothetical protein
MANSKIEEAAKQNARLHFHPDYNKDATTACIASFKAGAQWQFKAEQNTSAVSDEEIEKMAEKEYPFKVSNKPIRHFINTIKEVSRKAFIKGFKSALQTNVSINNKNK